MCSIIARSRHLSFYVAGRPDCVDGAATQRVNGKRRLRVACYWLGGSNSCGYQVAACNIFVLHYYRPPVPSWISSLCATARWMLTVPSTVHHHGMLDAYVAFWSEFSFLCQVYLSTSTPVVTSLHWAFAHAPHYLNICMATALWYFLWLWCTVGQQDMMAWQPLHFIERCGASAHCLSNYGLHHLLFWQFLYSK